MRYITTLILCLLFTFEASAKTILITASTGSIGTHASMHLAKEGYDLILTGRNQAKLDSLQKQILENYPEQKIETLIIDFSDIEKIQKNLAADNIKSVDGVVVITPRPILSKTDIPPASQWEAAFKETFIAPVETLRLLTPHLNNNGSIVLISGTTSKEYLPGYPNSNVIKLAWTAEIKNLSHFLKDKNTRVNALSPGVILTQHHLDNFAKKAKHNNISVEEQMSKSAKNIPLGRYAAPEEVSKVISFLLSEQSSYINGTNIVLDGGKSNSY